MSGIRRLVEQILEENGFVKSEERLVKVYCSRDSRGRDSGCKASVPRDVAGRNSMAVRLRFRHPETGAVVIVFVQAE